MQRLAFTDIIVPFAHNFNASTQDDGITLGDGTKRRCDAAAREYAAIQNGSCPCRVPVIYTGVGCAPRRPSAAVSAAMRTYLSEQVHPRDIYTDTYAYGSRAELAAAVRFATEHPDRSVSAPVRMHAISHTWHLPRLRALFWLLTLHRHDVQWRAVGVEGAWHASRSELYKLPGEFIRHLLPRRPA